MLDPYGAASREVSGIAKATGVTYTVTTAGRWVGLREDPCYPPEHPHDLGRDDFADWVATRDRLYDASGVDEAVLGSDVVKLLTAELVVSEPMEERDGSEHVPEGRHFDFEVRKGRLAHALHRVASERVVPRRPHSAASTFEIPGTVMSRTPPGTRTRAIVRSAAAKS